FALAADAEEIIAVGVNCCAPEDVPHAVETAARTTGKPVVAYPNSGETWNARNRTWDDSPTLTPAFSATGARLVGGCCRVGPETITAIARALGRV
ncbi:homocysteine S-methyltransferase, partial [Streptomyces sp. SID1328]